MAGFYSVAASGLRLLDAETAHALTIWALRAGLVPAAAVAPDPILGTTAMGLSFPSPVGLAAGFDKDAQVPDAMLALGFGFVEVGTVTPQLQPGNRRPRLFRLARERAIINRLGFNNGGLAVAAGRLAGRNRARGIVGANLGPNRDAAEPAADYETCIRGLAALADFFVLNVSSPNTLGLRDLQGRPIDALLRRAVAARNKASPGTPLVVKIAPDLDEGEVEAIVEAACAAGVEGLNVGNTSVGLREGLTGGYRREQGGLSGAPLMAASTRVLGQAARAAKERLALIGTGGVASGADAYAKLRAGACLVELYTALAYEGPELIPRIHAELAALLRRDGFSAVGDAVGADLP